MPAQDEQALLDILLANQAITQEVYDRVKLEHVNTGVPVEKLLTKRNAVNPVALAQAEAKLYNVPYIDLASAGIAPQAMDKLPEAVARRFTVFPFGYDAVENRLSVAMVDPLDLTVIEFLERKTNQRIIPYIATAQQIQEMIEEKYAQSLSAEVSAALEETAEYRPTQVLDIQKLSEVIRDPPIAKIVSTLLEFAIKLRASDVHIEPLEEKTRVRYRIDGILHEKLVLPRNVHDAVISRIKILSGMKIDEKRLPQDGRFAFKADDQEVDLRVSSLPSIHGEKIVMRLLQKSGNVPDLPGLGLRGSSLKNLENAIRVPHGIILVTGPTGSGKTTTLYSVLHRVSTPKVNIITLEDPVEYEMPGINQVQVNPQAGLTFASGMRSFLRQDPNIIMVGEIRDKETTELAIQAALTGHLVFSTLHTNSASGALPRLLDMGAEPYLLASSMTCVVAQRVVRKVCEACREAYDPSPEMLTDIKNVLGSLFKPFEGKPVKLYRGRKCDQCNGTGYLGRIGIFEAFPVDERMTRLILERAPATEIEKQAVADGMILMKQDGYLKALEGITGLEEVLRVAEVQ
jgi:type IV pilus assembly protein PilB